MDSDNQVVSVILPIYNAGRYLDQALASVEEQTYDAIEIICVNDGSTDDSLAIMRAHANRDARIRVINQPNRGYGAAMNRGIAEATGTWIAILEPDDWIEPDAYSEMIACARNFVSSDTPIDVIKTPYWVIRNPDTPDEVKLNCSYRHRVRPRRQPFQIHDAPHLLGHHPSIWSALYRRSFLVFVSEKYRGPDGPITHSSLRPFARPAVSSTLINRFIVIEKRPPRRKSRFRSVARCCRLNAGRIWPIFSIAFT